MGTQPAKSCKTSAQHPAAETAYRLCGILHSRGEFQQTRKKHGEYFGCVELCKEEAECRSDDGEEDGCARNPERCRNGRAKRGRKTGENGRRGLQQGGDGNVCGADFEDKT